jgi:hypothetical protein
LAALVSGAWTFFLFLGGMHQPSYYFNHLVWTCMVTAALMGLFARALALRMIASPEQDHGRIV